MVIRHTKLVLGALLIVFILASCKSSGAKTSVNIPKNVDPKYAANLQSALNEAGENAPELLKVLTTLKGEELAGASFLISTMPFPDLISIKADYLLEHIHYAYLIKHKYPWMKDMPEDTFLAYVLPYRMAEEPITAHRKYFYEQLDPLVRDCETMLEAAYQVNLWLGGERKDAPAGYAKQRVHFEPSEGRDKSPFATLLSSQGRCEEMMIIFMAATRAVGIPSRSVYTPYWPKCDNNHAWTEIWSGDKWFSMGSCEPSLQSAMAATAGRAWFTEFSATGAAIYCARFGQPEDKSTIYKASKKDSILNVLSNYSLTCKLDITVLDSDGQPVSGTPVNLSVVNWAVFQKVAMQKTDAQGKATLTTGIGQYMLSAGNNGQLDWQIISTKQGTLPVTMTLSAKGFPSGYYTLRFPETHAAYVAFNPAAANARPDPEVPERYKKINANHCPIAPPETYYCQEFKIEEHPDVNELIMSSPLSGNIISALKRSGGNWTEIAAAMKEATKEQKEDMFWLVAQMNLVDSIETNQAILLEHVKYSQSARSQMPVKVTDDIYHSYVLSPRMPYMHIYQWRKDLYDLLMPVVNKGGKPATITEAALRINRWIEQNIKIADSTSGRFFCSPNPADVFKSRRALKGGPVVSTVAALRAVGIPANIKSNWVEFYDGANWMPLYPMDSQNLGKTELNEDTKKQYVKKGGARIITTRNGFEYQPSDPNYGISRFSDGGWDGLEEELNVSNGWMTAAPGEYLLTAASRNANGDVLIYAQPITITSEKGIEVTVPLDLPVEMLSASERSVRELKTLPDFTLKDKAGQAHSFKEALKDNNILLVFFTLESEPSLRMLPLIQSTINQAKSAGVEIWPVLIDEKGENDERISGISLPILLDKDMAVAKQFIPDVAAKKKEIMPSVLLINKAGQIILWKEGYNLAINSILADSFTALLGGKSETTTLESLQKQVKFQETDLAGLEYIQKGLENLEGGNYAQAVEYYRKAVDCFPNISGLWYNYACALSRNNNIDDAFTALKKAIEFGMTGLDWAKKDPDLENLRRDKRFKELIP
ncbi:MAG TPA: transglutaminase domain-containing protein [Planctomycetota bacterium]|nr:transglutaminase domain-containing protein [Planctomycetota bacterium]